MFPKLFDPASIDPEAFARALRRPAAALRYVIYFTPRTGSSWLTDIATRTGRLSMPGECFNPHFVPGMARKFNAGDIDSYIEALVRRRNTEGVFGCQLTYFQLKKTFGSEERFLAHFGAAPCFWLIREDIILQAVSLSKKQQTKIGHRTMADAERLHAADREFGYDPENIRHWLKHIRKAEIRTEAMFAGHGLTPLRLSYEIITAMSPLQAVNVIAAQIGVPPVISADLSSDHQKIGTDKNAGFAARFRAQDPALVRRTEAQRAAMLAALVRVPAGL